MCRVLGSRGLWTAQGCVSWKLLRICSAMPCHAMVNDPSKGPLVLHGYGVGCTATPTTGAWGVVGMGAWRWEMVTIHWNGDTVSAALYRGKVPQLQSRKEVLVVGCSQVRSLASPLPAYLIITGRLVLTLAHCLHRLGTLVRACPQSTRACRG